MRDLDKAITALQPGINNGEANTTNAEAQQADDFLIQLSLIQRLKAEYKLPVVNLLGWWADIDTTVYVDHTTEGEPTVASLYTQLFNNNAVSGQIVGEIPLATGQQLAEKAAAIAAALRLSVEDFTRLQAAVPNDGVLTLRNLSLLYRHAALAAALKLRIPAYLASLALVGPAPFSTQANTIEFIKHIEKVDASGFKIEEFDYLLRNEISPTFDVKVTDEEIAVLLDAMRGDLRAISVKNTFVKTGIDDSAVTSDPTGDLTGKKLALLKWEPALIEQAIAALNDTYVYKTKLAALDSSIVFPQLLQTRILYDKAA